MPVFLIFQFRMKYPEPELYVQDNEASFDLWHLMYLMILNGCNDID
jgi:hypothetical protein